MILILLDYKLTALKIKLPLITDDLDYLEHLAD